MFFLWGLLIASPFVAATLLGIIWFGQLLLVPLMVGEHRTIAWFRPSFYLALITTFVSGLLIFYMIDTARNQREVGDWVIAAANVSAVFLVVSLGAVVIEAFRRTAISARTLLVVLVVALTLAGGLSWLLLA